MPAGSPIRHLRALVATWPGRFIAVVVVSQLLLPLHYYLLRRDPHDERFAWRMFSSTRMTTCTPRVTRDGVRVDLAHEFHEAWLALAARGRFSVIEAMGARLCAASPGHAVAVTLDCIDVDGTTRTWRDADMCQVPTL